MGGGEEERGSDDGEGEDLNSFPQVHPLHCVPLASYVPPQAAYPTPREGPTTHLGSCMATSGKRSSSFAPRSSVCSRERYETGLSMTKDSLSNEL